MVSEQSVQNSSSRVERDSDGAAARWNHTRGVFYWAVITFMCLPAAMIALALRFVPSRES
jgi:hypothetical protein